MYTQNYIKIPLSLYTYIYIYTRVLYVRQADPAEAMRGLCFDNNTVFVGTHKLHTCIHTYIHVCIYIYIYILRQ